MSWIERSKNWMPIAAILLIASVVGGIVTITGGLKDLYCYLAECEQSIKVAEFSGDVFVNYGPGHSLEDNHKLLEFLNVQKGRVVKLNIQVLMEPLTNGQGVYCMNKHISDMDLIPIPTVEAGCGDYIELEDPEKLVTKSVSTREHLTFIEGYFRVDQRSAPTQFANGPVFYLEDYEPSIELTNQ